MKLPEFVAGPAQQIRTVDPGQAAAVGQAISRSVGGALMGVAQAQKEYQDRYKKEQTDHEMRLAQSQLETNLSEFAMKYDKPLLSPDDIKAMGLSDTVQTTEEYVDDNGQKRQRDRMVPWEEAFPQAMTRQIEQYSMLAAENISDPMARENFNFSAKSLQAKSQVEMADRANKARHAAMEAQEAVQYEYAMSNQNYDGARELVRGSLLIKDSETRQKLLLGIDQQEAGNRIDTAIATQDIEAMQRELDDLSSKDYEGPFDPAKQKARANELRANIKSLTVKEDLYSKAQLAFDRDDAKRTMEAVQTGQLPVAEGINAVVEKANIVDPQTDADWLARRNVEMIAKNAGQLQELALASPSDKAAYIDSLPSSTDDERRYKEWVEEYSVNVSKAWANDSMSMAASQGIADITPLDSFGPDNVAGAQAEMQKRLMLHNQIRSDMGVSAGPLTDREAAAYAGALETMTANEKLLFFSTLEGGRGVMSQPIFAQIGKHAGDSSWVAGMLLAEGNPGPAKLILKGEDLQKGDVKVIKNPYVIGSTLHNKYRGLFAGDTALGSAQQAVTAYLVAKQYEAGKSGDDISSVANKTKEAIAAIYGAPLVTQNGFWGEKREFLPPTPKTTQDQWNKWVRTLPPAVLEPVAGISPTEARKRIDEGSLQPSPTKRRGQYFLLDVNQGSAPILRKDGTPFVLVYQQHTGGHGDF